MTNTNNSTPQENNSTPKPDYRAVARSIYIDNSTPWVETKTDVRKQAELVGQLKRLYNSPEALKAMGLCKVEEKEKTSNTLCKLICNILTVDGKERTDISANDRMEYLKKSEAELEEAKRSLKSVSEMRDRLLVALKETMGWYDVDCINDRHIVDIKNEAEDQIAKEKETNTNE